MPQKTFTKKKTVDPTPPPPATAPAPTRASAPAPSSVPAPTPPEPKKPRYEDLPIVSTLGKMDMKDAIRLMQEDIALQVAADENKASRAAIKEQLAEIAKRNKLPGMRHGRIAVYYSGEKTKWSLNRPLLLENGVTPQQIKDSMKESKPYVDLRVVDLDKNKDEEGEE